MILAEDDPLQILYRSEEAVLEPEEETERFDVVDNVVFPTAIDDRGGGRIDVYYGMADARMGAAPRDSNRVSRAPQPIVQPSGNLLLERAGRLDGGCDLGNLIGKEKPPVSSTRGSLRCALRALLGKPFWARIP
jgi:hypothetical protein